MSNYVLFCLDCSREFTLHMNMSEYEKGGLVCPTCGSKRVTQHVEAFSAVTSKKS